MCTCFKERKSWRHAKYKHRSHTHPSGISGVWAVCNIRSHRVNWLQSICEKFRWKKCRNNQQQTQKDKREVTEIVPKHAFFCPNSIMNREETENNPWEVTNRYVRLNSHASNVTKVTRRFYCESMLADMAWCSEYELFMDKAQFDFLEKRGTEADSFETQLGQFEHIPLVSTLTSLFLRRFLSHKSLIDSGEPVFICVGDGEAKHGRKKSSVERCKNCKIHR